MEKVFSGAIKHIGEKQTGLKRDGGTWVSQDFVVVDESGKYPETAMFSVTGAGVDILKYFKVGSLVTVKYNLNAREYKGKWYNDLRAWGVFKQEGEKKAVQKQEPSLNGDMANEFIRSQKVENDFLDLPF